MEKTYNLPYNAKTRQQVEKLAFHNLKRLMNKVRARISFWENTKFDYFHWETPEQFKIRVQNQLVELREYFEMLRDVSRKHPHKDTPKLKRKPQ